MALLSALGQELRRLRRLRGWTQSEVARSLGLESPSQISDWESGRRGVSREHFESLAGLLDVTVDHLRQYGDPYDPSAPRPVRRVLKSADDIRSALRERGVDAGEAPDASGPPIPLITEAQAGEGRLVYDNPASVLAYADRTVERPTWLRDPNAFAVLVKGDSMVPIYRPGTWVIVSPALPVRTGDEVFAAMKNGERVVKIAHRADGGYMLESANPQYPPRYVRGEDIVALFPVVLSQRREW